MYLYNNPPTASYFTDLQERSAGAKRGLKLFLKPILALKPILDPVLDPGFLDPRDEKKIRNGV